MSNQYDEVQILLIEEEVGNIDPEGIDGSGTLDRPSKKRVKTRFPKLKCCLSALFEVAKDGEYYVVNSRGKEVVLRGPSQLKGTNAISEVLQIVVRREEGHPVFTICLEKVVKILGGCDRTRIIGGKTPPPQRELKICSVILHNRLTEQDAKKRAAELEQQLFAKGGAVEFLQKFEISREEIEKQYPHLIPVNTMPFEEAATPVDPTNAQTVEYKDPEPEITVASTPDEKPRTAQECLELANLLEKNTRGMEAEIAALREEAARATRATIHPDMLKKEPC